MSAEFAVDGLIRRTPLRSLGAGVLLAAVAYAMAAWWGAAPPSSLAPLMAAVLLSTACVVWPHGRTSAAALVLAAAALAYAIWRIGVPPPDDAPRLLRVAACLLLALPVILVPLALLGVSAPRGWALLLCTVASLWTGEALLPRLRPELTQINNVAANNLRSDERFHPRLGWLPPPFDAAITEYPSDPRNYFETRTPLGDLDVVLLEATAPHGVRIGVQPPLDSQGPATIEVQSQRRHGDGLVSLTALNLPLLAQHDYEMTFQARSETPQTIDVDLMAEQPATSGPLLDWQVELSDPWQTFRYTFKSPTDGLHHLRFKLGPRSRRFQLAQLRFAPLDPHESHGPPRFTVRHIGNQHGFRDRPRDPSPSPDMVRVACLGDSFTFGQGVHFDDLLTVRLETALNADARRGQRRFEVLNFGVSGYDTAQERLLYEEIAAAYRPQIVLLLMVNNDYAPYHEQFATGRLRPVNLWERTFYSWRLLRRIEPAPQSTSYGGCVREARQLDRECRLRDARLGAVVFRNTDDPSWSQFAQEIQLGMDVAGIPCLDLGETLLAEHAAAELVVHPTDGHPNEIAHRRGAQLVHEFLFDSGLLTAEPDK